MSNESLEVDKTKPVLVTGGNGYLSSWVIKILMEKGIPVRTTVRNTTGINTRDFLGSLQASGSPIEIFEADLLEEGSFDEAAKGCEVVFHIASPFKIFGVKKPVKELIEPALQGTENVLSAVSKSGSVKKVILTSSTVSIHGDAVEASKEKLNESSWNLTSSEKNSPYAYSKKLAEEKAWEIKNSQSNWNLIAINPGFILGPSLSKRVDSFSIDFMLSLINGKNKSGVPEFAFPVVDVRDVAKAHVNAAFNKEANGRYIITSGESPFYMDIADIIRNKYGDKLPIPKKTLPRFMLYLIGPFMNVKWGYLKKNLGIQPLLDNSKSIRDLDLNYRKLSDTIIDHVDQLMSDNLI